jgi:hypothetical protein
MLSLAHISVTIAVAAGKQELPQVRRATKQFRSTEAAQRAGWDLVPGLDHCFDNQPVGGMGYHYTNEELLGDIDVNALMPEALVYAPSPSGKLKLAAVEYIVPAELWDAENNELPTLFGQRFHLDDTLGVYVLHAWIWKGNPAGTFEDWNPNVACPEI